VIFHKHHISNASILFLKWTAKPRLIVIVVVAVVQVVVHMPVVTQPHKKLGYC